jgi:hypothetical protein
MLVKHVYVDGFSAMLAFVNTICEVHYLVDVGVKQGHVVTPRIWRRSSPFLKQMLN